MAHKLPAHLVRDVAPFGRGAVYYALGSFDGRPAVKIGFTTTAPNRRVRALNARLLACEPGTGFDEIATHHMFDADRIFHEWYRPSLRLLLHIGRVGMQLDPAVRISGPVPRGDLACLIDWGLGDIQPVPID